MLDDLPREVTQSYLDNACRADELPGLGPLRALAETQELADATAGLRDSYGHHLSASDPLYPLARDVAHALTEAGFTLHHCAQHDPLYRLGGLCLLPVSPGHDPGAVGGVVVSWATHNLLSLDWDRWDQQHGIQEVMNGALAE